MIWFSDNTLMSYQINLEDTCEPVKEKKNDINYIEWFHLNITTFIPAYLVGEAKA